MDDPAEQGTPHRFRITPRNHSLRRQLVIWVLLPQLVLWFAGGIATYRLAVRYVNQAADATLSQATRALARRVKPIGNGLLIDFPRAAQEVLETDPNDRLYYMVSTPPGEFILGNNSIPMPPRDMSKRRTPASSAATVLTRPMARVLWKCAVKSSDGKRARARAQTSCTCVG